MDVTTLGVSVLAVGAVSSLLVQAIKAVTRRVSWLPTLSGGTTAIVAYAVAVGLMYALALAGYGPSEQEGMAAALTTLAAGLGSGLVSQGVYVSGKKIARAGEVT